MVDFRSHAPIDVRYSTKTFIPVTVKHVQKFEMIHYNIQSTFLQKWNNSEVC